MPFHFIVPRHSLFPAGGDLPRSNGCRLNAATGIPPVGGGPETHAASYRDGDFFSGRIVFALLLPFGLKQKSDGGAQIGQTLLFRLPLPVGSGDLKTGGPETAFLRLTRVHYSRDRGHTVKLGISRGPSSPTKAGVQGMAGDWRLETEGDTVDGGPANGDWGPEAGGREPMGGPAHAKALRRDKRWIRRPARDGPWP